MTISDTPATRAGMAFISTLEGRLSSRHIDPRSFRADDLPESFRLLPQIPGLLFAGGETVRSEGVWPKVSLSSRLKFFTADLSPAARRGALRLKPASRHIFGELNQPTPWCLPDSQSGEPGLHFFETGLSFC
jgi:hypothetical protein